MEAADHTDVLPIGRKIEKIRRLYGITQTELGELLSVSKQAVSKMEQAKQMDDERLLAIANALHVTTDAIKNFNENAAFNITLILTIITLLRLSMSLTPLKKYCSFTMKKLLSMNV